MGLRCLLVLSVIPDWVRYSCGVGHHVNVCWRRVVSFLTGGFVAHVYTSAN